MRHGFLLVRKPIGPTSHDIVSEVRSVLHEPKVGHLGTLDPMASGLLVLAVGQKALKVVELFQALPKEYIAEIHLGAVSTTYDSEGMIEERSRKAGWVPPVDASKIQAVIDDHFLGKRLQVPPIFSAVNVGGERAYRKAQRGESVELKAREKTIYECKVIEYNYPKLKLRVRCDSGTYIRSLANDLGETLRCGGYLKGLERTKVGEWPVKNAVDPKTASWTDVLPLKELLKSLPGKELSEKEWEDVRHGRSIEGGVTVAVTIGWEGGLPVALLERDSRKDGMLKPKKVL